MIKYLTISLFKKIGDELYKILSDFDIICGIPCYISTTYNKPMIYIRVKN